MPTQSSPTRSAPAPSVPIFQPGAPGQASRIVTPEAARALGRTTFTADDVRFMQHMIVHHAQAVEMVELLQMHGTDPTVGLMGRRIALSQEAEIALMRGWLAERGQAEAMTDMAGMHAGHGGMDHSAHMNPAAAAPDPDDVAPMAGMLTPREMRTLADARGTGMIQHHQGALDMVDDLMTRPDAANDTMLSDFAAAVVADQQAEILRMQSLLSDL
jgi:uncharacterized protein (DUF305 family)